MYSKIKISGQIEVVTGLHIGSGEEIGMIGAIDAPIVRDPKSHMPIIPGSSIKGKLRSLLSKNFNDQLVEHNEDVIEVRRLFGSSGEELVLSRLQISDAFYSEQSKSTFDSLEVNYTEVKFENTINRLTGVAKPRQIERVNRGSIFDFQFIYNVEKPEEVKEDFKNIQKAITLLENDYLGGGGSRGNGRVKFKNISIETVIGNYDSSKLKLK